MDFLDRTGHIFSLPSYSDYPVGYEYQINDYIFWINNSKSYKLSIDTYYFKAIKLLLPLEGDINSYSLTISLESDKFFLLGSKNIEALINENIKNQELNKRIEIYEDTLSKKLTFEDLSVCKVLNNSFNSVDIPFFKRNGQFYTDEVIIENGIAYANVQIGPIHKKVELDKDENDNYIFYKKEYIENINIPTPIEEKTVTITFNNSEITTNDEYDTVTINENSVVINSLSEDIKYILTGTSSNASITFNFSKKTQTIELNDLSLTSLNDRNINIKNKSNTNIIITGNNTLSDNGTNLDKGFSLINSNGDLTFSGNGTLNCISTGKGSKAINADNITINSSNINITSSGNPAVEEVDNVRDFKISAPIKVDDTLTINSGNININTSAPGSKGFNVLNLIINDGNINIKNSGEIFTLPDLSDNKKPKAIKADGNITINGGTLKAESTNDEGISADHKILVTGGYVFVKAKDDAINSGSSEENNVADGNFEITGGFVVGYSYHLNSSEIGADGIDANGNIIINGGTLIGINDLGFSAESGFDVDPPMEKNNYVHNKIKVISGTFLCTNVEYYDPIDTAQEYPLYDFILNTDNTSYGNELSFLANRYYLVENGKENFIIKFPSTVNNILVGSSIETSITEVNSVDTSNIYENILILNPETYTKLDNGLLWKTESAPKYISQSSNSSSSENSNNASEKEYFIDSDNKIHYRIPYTITTDNSIDFPYPIENGYFIIENDNVESENTYYTIIPFYVLAKSSDPGNVFTNILIDYNDLEGEREYCPITVGGEFVDEFEELIINGKNMGVNLPKDIIKAVYSGNYYSSYPDEKFYAQKLKEYLMNFMDIKGIQGNFKSAINSLKWFEWGDKLTINKLLKNDNLIQSQYVRDYFDLINDTLYSYQFFRNSSLISLSLSTTKEGEETPFDFSSSFWGEAKPKIVDLFQEMEEVRYDELDIPFYKNYFDYTFNELGLKLCALKYYYEKYFLPIHLKINSISLSRQVWMNDMKLISNTYNKITEAPVCLYNVSVTSKMNVIFPKYHEIFYTYYDNLYTDEYFTEFEKYSSSDFRESTNIDLFEINDNCIRIPISFKKYENDIEVSSFYDCLFTLSRYMKVTSEGIEDRKNKGINTIYYYKENDNYTSIGAEVSDEDIDKYTDIYICETLYNNRSQFVQDIEDENTFFKSIVLYPKLINRKNKFDINFWLLPDYRLDILVNNSFYTYKFKVIMPEFNIELGKLVYKYHLPYTYNYLLNPNNGLAISYYDANDNYYDLRPTMFTQVQSINGDTVNFNIPFIYQADLITIDNIDYLDDLMELEEKNLISKYINRYYKSDINLISNKYLNRVHILNLFDKNGNEIRRSILNPADLYRAFFKDNGRYKDELYKELTINNVDYDFYLMHDTPTSDNLATWFVVLISKTTLNIHSTDDKKFYFSNKKKSITIGDYILKYNRSESKVLINRLDYIPSNGNNHFEDTDLIVMRLRDNDTEIQKYVSSEISTRKLSFKLTLGSKWKVTPFSIGMDKDIEISSNDELAILSINDKFSKYPRGYYNVSVSYSIDDYTQHEHTQKAKFRVN